MLDNDFIMEKKNKYFPNAFGFSDANAKKSQTLMEKYGKKAIYLKAETECIDDAGMTVKLPKYTQFVIKNIIVENRCVRHWRPACQISRYDRRNLGSNQPR